MKKFILLSVFLFLTMCVFAQTPKWVRSLPKAENDSYFYMVEYATANNERDAKNQAMAKIFQSTANRLGQAFKSDEIHEAVMNGTNYSVVSKNYNIPINKVCEYTEKLVSGYKVYVLCQVATKGHITPYWSHFSECGKTESNSIIASSFIPGMAQIKKGQNTKGTCFIASEIVFISSAILSQNMMNSNINKINSTHNSSLKYQYTKNANTWMTTRNISIAGAVAVYIWNVIDGIAADKTKSSPYSHNVSVTPYADFNSTGIALNFKL